MLSCVLLFASSNESYSTSYLKGPRGKRLDRRLPRVSNQQAHPLFLSLISFLHLLSEI